MLSNKYTRFDKRLLDTQGGMGENQEDSRIVKAVDDVIAKYEERVDARKDEDLEFLRKLRANLVGSLRGLSSASKKEGPNDPLG
jgi:hypothetical protein